MRHGVEEQLCAHPWRRIDLQIDLPSGMACVPVAVDADRIGQVLANYLINALKYSPMAAPVSVTAAVDDDSLAVAVAARGRASSVHDGGSGLQPEARSRVWERFHWILGVVALSGSGIGLGLGLYPCRELVERQGGRVGVESVAGEGATF
jgi:signal transduction histidine kinase